ncbi:VanZ family protein [Bacillaceae bacterium Marseille-Q3522]|nr:VanZ family protein [Bacillaceae bacterium Marseille-Q3522]
MNHKISFFIWLSLTVIVLYTIFHASGTPYKKQDIRPILEDIVALDKDSLPYIAFHYGEYGFITTEKPYTFIEFIIRKMGHVFEYMVVAFLFIRLLQFSKLKFSVCCLLGLSLAFLVACSDEWHQSFVPGRTGQAIDVFTFDLLGITIGVLIWMLIHTRGKRKCRN